MYVYPWFFNRGASRDEICSELMKHEDRMVGSKLTVEQKVKTFKYKIRKIVREPDPNSFELISDSPSTFTLAKYIEKEVFETVERRALVDEYWEEKWNKYKGKYSREKINEVFISYVE